MSKIKTTEDFIEKATNIHNGKYDYSKVNYINALTKVCIICPEHGEFWQSPSSHLQGRGCNKCALELKRKQCEKNRKKRKNESKNNFEKKANIKHNYRYDYSKVVYVNSKTKICIICPEHGEFWQLPYEHLKGSGCPKCVGKHKWTTETIIAEFKKIHGDKYDYSKVEYNGIDNYVTIICPIHGEFQQTPYNHLQNHGCPKCNNCFKKTTEEFIAKAQQIHGNKYDYSKVKYTNAKTKICIICPEHGEFWQTPHSHLRKRGCPKCANKNVTSEEFIKKARKIHGDRYDYSKVVYVNNSIKVCIICPEHGEFWQTPDSHLSGCGCTKCKQSHLEREIYNLLKQNEFDFEYNKKYKLLNNLQLDFYIPKLKIAIECQGEQHFKIMRYHLTNEENQKNLEQIQYRDKTKHDLCNHYGIKILYYSNLGINYPYYVFEDKMKLLEELFNVKHKKEG